MSGSVSCRGLRPWRSDICLDFLREVGLVNELLVLVRDPHGSEPRSVGGKCRDGTEWRAGADVRNGRNPHLALRILVHRIVVGLQTGRLHLGD